MKDEQKVTVKVGEDTFEVNKEVISNVALIDKSYVDRGEATIGIVFANKYLSYSTPHIVMTIDRAKELYKQLGEALQSVV